MISCKTILSIDGGAPTACLPITACNAVSLCKSGVTSEAMADAVLALDEHDELVVVRHSETPVMLERSGRKISLRAGRPIRICEKDTLWIEGVSICMVKSTFIHSKPAPRHSFMRTAQRLVAASAAVFSLAAFTSCNESGGCNHGESSCKNNSVYVCIGGAWQLSEKCESDAVCTESDNSTAYCALTRTSGAIEPEECTPGAMKCSDNAAYKCDGGHWAIVTQCPAESQCVKKSNTSAVCEFSTVEGGMTYTECDDDAMKCEKNNVYKCIDGTWKLEETCAADSSCIEESNTSAICEPAPLAGDIAMDCQNDEMKCEDNQVMRCIAGLWVSEDDCNKQGAECIEFSNTSAVCDMGPTSGILPAQECPPGEMKCSDNQALKCSDDGLWELSEKCADDAVCIEHSNTSAVCEVEMLEGEPVPPDIPTPEPVRPPEEDA